MMHLRLINEWTPNLAQKVVLKTDLFEEALGDDHFFDDVALESGEAIGIDISGEITRMVLKRSKSSRWNGLSPISADVRWLPFAAQSFDVVISNSTLDHFSDTQSIVSGLKEIRRVLKPEGQLILTMDNMANPFYYAIRLLSLLRLTPYYVGKTFSRNKLLKVLRDSGFLIEDVRSLSHHPRMLTLAYLILWRRIFPARADRHNERVLQLFDRLGRTRIKFVTGAFIAVKAKRVPIIS